ncbi:RHS repeat-associated core domain-containing protein [Flavobacterium sp. NRK F10]|uniref:RHS repeat domain-containing protein n=1 Tax=Flavobacterium sp. NRK F10 TaxID=2954931 RepID=UPI002091CF08|nr:RHS repeat-associated core domain-containing protein [Flavobacterium sp. NRK F10]MCO6174102.1 RHS repeat-associated core domain-containing protein [Flavobacterium sp. NRK F10]
MKFFPHAEGYVNVTEACGFLSSCGFAYNYVFNYTDHLGNIRLSYGIDPATSTLKIMEENHYYPFGLKHANYNSDELLYQKGTAGAVVLKGPTTTVESVYKFKFNGFELQDELGLNWYDYQARNYDPALGRWMNIDPLAETSRRFSPYTYALDNPLRFIDPDGMQADDIIYYNRNGTEVHRIASNTINKVYMINDDYGNSIVKSATTVAIQSTSTVEGAEMMNTLLSSSLSEPDSMSISFTGTASATGGKDSLGRDKYTAEGNLSVNVGFENGAEAEIQNISADSGPWGFGPTPNGDYTGSSIVNTSESGMVRDGIGFKVYLSDNTALNRNQLRIHPDQVPSEGTAGCIGITEDAAALQQFRGQVQNHFQNNPNTNISVNVNVTNNPNYNRPEGGRQNSGE